MSMVRDHVEGEFNLAVGEPFFLQKGVYGPLYPTGYKTPVLYPALGGEKKLVDLLKARHPDKHIVVTNGAKQALAASIYAIDRSSNGHSSAVYHPAPYWPSYPTIASMSGLGFRANHGLATDVTVITYPNNPTGVQPSLMDQEYDIWDAAYASLIYGFTGKEPKHKMSVWSAAKLFGVSGYRIGWVATENERLAQLAAEFVEKTTSGVSILSQMFLYRLLGEIKSSSLHSEEQFTKIGSELLCETSNEFMHLAMHVPIFERIEGHPLCGQGMFAWVKAKDPARFELALELAKVKVVAGKHCGQNEPGWYRISLGVMPDVMRAAVKAILEVY